MVISSFISSILILALGIWAYVKLESSMNTFAEKQLIIEPSKFSYKMWKDMPVTMYQTFTFFNCTNWNQVKSIGQKPRFVEIGPYVYKTVWTKSDINFQEDERQVSFSEKKQWMFQPHLSKGSEDDQIWTVNTPLMTALALIQNAPVITRNIVSVILDGLGEGAFIKRNIRSLLFEGYSDLIVSVGPLFDRRFANFNGKFAYLYNKNDTVDGIWTVSTGREDIQNLNKILKFQSNIINMTSSGSQGLNEVKSECVPAWSLDQATNGQLFAPFDKNMQLINPSSSSSAQSQPSQQLHHQTLKPRSRSDSTKPDLAPSVQLKNFFSRNSASINQHESSSNNLNNRDQHQHHHQNQPQTHDLVPNPFFNSGNPEKLSQKNLNDYGKYIFYPDLCRPIHLIASKLPKITPEGIEAYRYHIDPRVFMNSSQVPSNKCYEMNPRPPLANALAATINSVTGANVAMPNLVTGASSPFAMFSPANNHHHTGNENSPASTNGGSLFERSNHPVSFINNAIHSLSANNNHNNNNQDGQSGQNGNGPISRLSRVRQLFSNIVSQRMSAGSPGSLLPNLASSPSSMLGIGNHFQHSQPPFMARNAPEAPQPPPTGNLGSGLLLRRQPSIESRQSVDGLLPVSSNQAPAQQLPPSLPAGGSDRWITQFRFKWPKGVFSIGQCQLGAPIYASLPHFLDADEYYLEQVDGLKPNKSLHEFYIDIESSLHSIPVGAKARLQLNVATPELRFRNIPNAMIPVLWQEVTFKIDKPVATMLYWSFTMSSTLYYLTSIIIILLGLVVMVYSFVGGLGRRSNGAQSDSENSRDCSDSLSSTLSERKRASSSRNKRHQRVEGQRSSWQPHMMNHHSCKVRSVAGHPDLPSHISSDGSMSGDNMDSELRLGAAVNRGFVLSNGGQYIEDIPDNIRPQNVSVVHACLANSAAAFVATGSRNGQNNITGSPRQPSSRASSLCELVSSLGNTSTATATTVTCANCFLACLRHSQHNSKANSSLHAATNGVSCGQHEGAQDQSVVSTILASASIASSDGSQGSYEIKSNAGNSRVRQKKIMSDKDKKGTL